MGDSIYVQYVGVESKGSVRQNIFCVRTAPSEPREFVLTIANESFTSHQARYQDAPGSRLNRLSSQVRIILKKGENGYEE